MSYEAIDRVCNEPMLPDRAMNEAYVSALEEAVTAAQRSAGARAPQRNVHSEDYARPRHAEYWCDDDYVR